jgi:hypothetical protein
MVKNYMLSVFLFLPGLAFASVLSHSVWASTSAPRGWGIGCYDNDCVWISDPSLISGEEFTVSTVAAGGSVLGTYPVTSVRNTITFRPHSVSELKLLTGVWIASELMRFDSHGIAPGALLNGRRTFGSSQLGPKGLPMSSGPMPTGGLAVFRIRLLPMSGTSKTAVLQANCALGKVPAEREIEGIRLSFERNGTAFAQEAGGRVMFLMMRPEVSALVKTPQQEAAPDSAEPQN